MRAQSLGWTSATVLVGMIAGAALLAGFVARERRTGEPMLPMSFFAKRSFAVTNVASLSMYFGMFGSIFFLSQYMQNVLGNTPLQAGLKLLVWTGATMVVAPLAGVFSERLGSRPFMFAGLSLQAGALAWFATMASTHLAYSHMIVPFVMAGAGMALVFAPSANAVLSSVRTEQAGQASGANNAIREVGGVLGVAVLASVFTGAGGYASPQVFVNGLIPALWVGVAVLGAGALTVLALPFKARSARGRRRGGARGARGARRARDGARGRGGGVSETSEQGARERRVRRRVPAGQSRRAREPGSGSAEPEQPRRRVPAAERREELISAAVHEFARGGLHGTAVDRIARRVGVAQPYVFSLFPNKRELFLAALERGFQRVADTFAQRRADYREGRAPADCEDALRGDGHAYKELLASDRDYLMLQHQSYAACDDEVVRARVRRRYAELVALAGELSGAEPSAWTTSSDTAWP